MCAHAFPGLADIPQVTKALRKRTKEAGQKVIQSVLEEPDCGRGRGGTKRRAVSKGVTAAAVQRASKYSKKGRSRALLKGWGV